MKLQIIVLRDIIADVYGQPSFVPSIGGAIRQFGDECTRQADDNMLYKHPEHFELWHVGTYDDNEAHFDTTERRQIAAGANYKR